LVNLLAHAFHCSIYTLTDNDHIICKVYSIIVKILLRDHAGFLIPTAKPEEKRKQAIQEFIQDLLDEKMNKGQNQDIQQNLQNQPQSGSGSGQQAQQSEADENSSSLASDATNFSPALDSPIAFMTPIEQAILEVKKVMNSETFALEQQKAINQKLIATMRFLIEQNIVREYTQETWKCWLYDITQPNSCSSE